MKTKLLTLKFISFLIISSCSPTLMITEVIKTKDVTFEPKFISKEIDDNLFTNIEPIDAKSINKEILNSLSFDGSYSYEKNYIYYNYLKENQKESSSERKLRETIIKLFEQVDILHNSNQITLPQSFKFKEKIYSTFVEQNLDYGEHKPEYNTISDNISNNINPYYSNNKYFSLFKLTFKNKESQIKDLKIEDFQVFSEGELLYPFKNSYFENKFKKVELMNNDNDQEKLKTIYRMNMPDNIKILNNQPIVKYFSTPALNSENQNLIVNYINGEKVIDFNFNVHTKENTTEIKLIQHKIKYKKRSIYPNFNIIEVNDIDYLLKSDKFYLEKNNENLKLFTLNVDKNNKKVKLTVTTFNTNNLIKNTIIVDN
ncbi:MAG TPA: hypothetical protein VL022_02680 [Moheibacter sp.]|nr:hypothetical protein [Moheibacter sp.]